MSQNKLYKFKEISSFPNVFQFDDTKKGSWHQHFKNEHPITLELACGKGEYSTGLGEQYPHRNFIGIDIKGNRIYTGAKLALEKPLPNVAYLRARIDHIEKYFSANEVDEIWIVFPDPFLREAKAKNRLTHHRFLQAYQKILKPGAKIHLKTDSNELYQFTKETLDQLQAEVIIDGVDIYRKDLLDPALSIQTFYEKMHLARGRKIYYLQFCLPEKPLPIYVKTNKQLNKSSNA